MSKWPDLNIFSQEERKFHRKSKTWAAGGGGAATVSRYAHYPFLNWNTKNLEQDRNGAFIAQSRTKDLSKRTSDLKQNGTQEKA